MPESVVTATQTVLCLMGNIHQQMAHERLKKVIFLSLKFMANDQKNFSSAALILFGGVSEYNQEIEHLRQNERALFLVSPSKLPKQSSGEWKSSLGRYHAYKEMATVKFNPSTTQEAIKDKRTINTKCYKLCLKF